VSITKCHSEIIYLRQLIELGFIEGEAWRVILMVQDELNPAAPAAGFND